MSHHYVPWVLGFVFSVLVGHLTISIAMNEIWRAVGVDPRTRPLKWMPAALGLLERALFTAAILVGQAGFIGVWLGVKTVARYRSWGDHLAETTSVSEREIFSVFLLGQGLSIGFAAAGAVGTTLLQTNKVAPAALLAGSTVAGTLAFAGWIMRQRRKAVAVAPRS